MFKPSRKVNVKNLQLLRPIYIDNDDVRCGKQTDCVCVYFFLFK